MLTVYMDESGFTGEDLSSSQQPLFVHVSTTLSDQECAELRSAHFAGVQGSELKHKNLAKWPSGQSRVVDLIKALDGDANKVTVWVCHKEFTLLTYLVDLWVEPAMYDDGVDLYQDGGNLALSNMAYFCLRTFQGDKFLSDLLRRFQRMMIKRAKKSFDGFFGTIDQDMGRVDERTRSILIMFLGAGMKLGYDHLIQLPQRALDPAFTTALNTCGRWHKLSGGPLTLVHDQSSSLAKDKWLWDLIASPALQKTIIGVPGREMEFPVNVAQVAFADSKSHLQLQFCDIVAGASAMWHRQLMGLTHSEAYVGKLSDAGIDKLRIGAIWPSPEVNPDALGTRGMKGKGVDELARQVQRLDKSGRASESQRRPIEPTG